MDDLAVTERVSKVFHEVFADDALVLRRDMTAAEVDGWDSLNHIRLVVSLQRAFGIRFSAVEIGKLKNVGELMDLVKAKM